MAEIENYQVIVLLIKIIKPETPYGKLKRTEICVCVYETIVHQVLGPLSQF